MLKSRCRLLLWGSSHWLSWYSLISNLDDPKRKTWPLSNRLALRPCSISNLPVAVALCSWSRFGPSINEPICLRYPLWKILAKCFLFGTSRLNLPTLRHLLLSAIWYRDGRIYKNRLEYCSLERPSSYVFDTLTWTSTSWPFRKQSECPVALSVIDDWIKSFGHRCLSRRVSKAVNSSQVDIVQSNTKWPRVIAELSWRIRNVDE